MSEACFVELDADVGVDVGMGICSESQFEFHLPPMKAMPTESFRFCPPERVLVFAFSFSVSPTSSRVFCGKG